LVSVEYISKYFDKNGEVYTIKDEVKKCVEFKQHDLLKETYPNDCDLIVCRNVLIYFTEEAKNTIYVKFNQALKTQGILFVGSTEQILIANKYDNIDDFARALFFIKKKNKDADNFKGKGYR
jgi:chemotaxis protein methyltransferase CheR